MQRLPLRLPLNPDAPVWFLSETDSTMDDARALVTSSPSRGQLQTGTTIITDYQRSGRGRREGRRWHAPPRTSLMATLCLRDDPEPATASLALAVAVADEVEERLPAGAGTATIRWPNDVLLDTKKVCGILANYVPPWLLLGFGLNLLQTAFPPPLGDTATSLRIAGALAPEDARSWESLRSALLIGITRRFMSARTDWHTSLQSRLWGKGEPAEVTLPGGETIRGRLEEVLPDGRLGLRGDSFHRLAAGEVSLIRGLRG